MTAAEMTVVPLRASVSQETANDVPVVTTSSTRITGDRHGWARNRTPESCSLPARPWARWALPPSLLPNNLAAPIPSSPAARRASTQVWSMPLRRTAAGREGTGTRIVPFGGWQAATATASRRESNRDRTQAPSSLKAGMSRTSSGRYGLAAQAGNRTPGRRTRCGRSPAILSRQAVQQATAGKPQIRHREPSSKDAKSQRGKAHTHHCETYRNSRSSFPQINPDN